MTHVSELLFDLTVEILEIKIRSSSSLEGISISNKKCVKISQYPDDGILSNKLEHSESADLHG